MLLKMDDPGSRLCFWVRLVTIDVVGMSDVVRQSLPKDTWCHGSSHASLCAHTQSGICISRHMSVHVSMRMSICMHIHMSVHMSICMSIDMSPSACLCP